MGTNEVHELDIDTVFVSTIKDQDGVVVDVSGAVAAGTKLLTFKRTDGSTLEKEASFYTDGTDGKLSWTTIAGDVRDGDAGEWEWQAKAIIGSGTFHSDIKEFTVFRNL